MRAAPPSIFFFQSTAVGVPGGAMKISAEAAGPGTCPTDERTVGHEPDCGPSTANVPPKQAGAIAKKTSGRMRLFRERIPYAGPEIIEVRPVRISLIHQISPPDRIQGHGHRFGHGGKAKTKSRPRFDKIRP